MSQRKVVPQVWLQSQAEGMSVASILRWEVRILKLWSSQSAYSPWIPWYLPLYLYGSWRIVPGGDQQYYDDVSWVVGCWLWGFVLNTFSQTCYPQQAGWQPNEWVGLTHASVEWCGGNNSVLWFCCGWFVCCFCVFFFTQAPYLWEEFATIDLGK